MKCATGAIADIFANHLQSGSALGRGNLGGGSFFRTTNQDGKLIGSFLIDTPAEFKTAVENSSNFKLISIEPATSKSFLEHEASAQESL